MPWWRFWRPETAEEIKQNLQQQADLEALMNGDIPSSAKQRIALELQNEKPLFSSNLSVREFLLTKEAGIQTISQVMGTAFYNVSFWGSYMGPFRNTGELKKVTIAQTEARQLAISRMRKEAQLLGATGVIGVRLHANPSPAGERMTEFTAYGTAVRIPDYPAEEEPFTSNLDGQEFWQLYRAGYRPKALVSGFCSYCIQTTWATNMQMYGILGLGNFTNQELAPYTQGFYNARNLALQRLTDDLTKLEADGCVGMKVDYDIEKIIYSSSNESQFDLLINFYCLGTAVNAGIPSVQHPSKIMCLNLNDKKAIENELTEAQKQLEAELRARFGENITIKIKGADPDL